MEKKYDGKTLALAAVLIGVTLLIAACNNSKAEQKEDEE